MKFKTIEGLVEGLTSFGIVTKVGTNYYITEKYKDLIALEGQVSPGITPAIISENKVDSIINDKTSGNLWPEPVLKASGRVRVTVLMDHCKVPDTALGVSGAPYRLRASNKTSAAIVANLIDDKDIHPSSFINAITKYYQHTEMPKAFKNLLENGEALDLYNEYIKGTLDNNLGLKPDNTGGKWR